MFISRGFLVLVAISISACVANKEHLSLGDADQFSHQVSITELVGSPATFDGVKVRVIGVASFNFGFEQSSALYTSIDACRAGSFDAVSITELGKSFPDAVNEMEKFDCRWVILEGIYNVRPNSRPPFSTDHALLCFRRCYGGQIHSINRVDSWEWMLP